MVNHMALEEVVLESKSDYGFKLVYDEPSILCRYLQINNVVVDQGADISLLTEGKWVHFQVLMCTPVKQGLVNEKTKFILSSKRKLSSLRIINEVKQGEVDVNYEYLVDTGSMKGTGCFFPSFDSEEEKYEFPGKQRRKTVKLCAGSLDAKIPEDIIFPRPEMSLDDETFTFVRVETLGRYHLLSGDRVLIEGPDSTKKRMCRIFGIEEKLLEGNVGAEIYMSPSLLYNLGIKTSPATSRYVHISYFGEAANPCIIREAILSRVPTPISTGRIYEKTFIKALKDYFQSKDRVICEGDVIGIPFDEDEARLDSEKTTDNEDNLNFVCLRKSIKIRRLKIVYFHVTKIKFSKASPPAFFLGGIADFNLTKLIEDGISNIGTPSLRRYLNATCDIPPLPRTISDKTAFTSLLNIASSSAHPLAIELGLSCSVLLHGARGNGKRVLAAWVAEKLGLCFYDVNCFELTGEADAKAWLRSQFDIAAKFAPCLFVLRNIEALASKKVTIETRQEPVISSVMMNCLANIAEVIKKKGQPVLIVATTSDLERVPNSLLNCFRHEIQTKTPDEAERFSIIKTLTANIPIAPDVSLSYLAKQTASLVAKDLVDLISRAGVAGLERISRAMTTNGEKVTLEGVIKAGVILTSMDFDRSLSKVRASYLNSIGAPEIPKVTWDDIGGLASVKADILDTIQLPLEHPELFASGMKKRSGILFYGPPGTGKTMLAKAVATSCSLNFFSVKGPELLNMYIGESEANIRRVFQRARDAKPCVIFFDELDSIAPKRGEKGDSGGVMDRIVSQILAELDGMSSCDGSTDIYVIGATNRPDLLDPALLRPGRFDRLIYLGISEDHESQLKILQALTRKFRLAPDLDLFQVAKKCPFNYTGADFYALCSDAMLKAMSRTSAEIDQRIQKWNENPPLDGKYPKPMTLQYYLDRLAKVEEIGVMVQMVDFENAQLELVPSVSQHELEDYKRIRSEFSNPKPKENSDIATRSRTSISSSDVTVSEAISQVSNGSHKSSLFRKYKNYIESVKSDTKAKTKKKEKVKNQAKTWATIHFS